MTFYLSTLHVGSTTSHYLIFKRSNKGAPRKQNKPLLTALVLLPSFNRVLQSFTTSPIATLPVRRLNLGWTKSIANDAPQSFENQFNNPPIKSLLLLISLFHLHLPPSNNSSSRLGCRRRRGAIAQ